MRDKVVIITGGSSGIGKALAMEFARRNAKIVIASRNVESLGNVEQELKAKGADVISLKADVSIQDDCKKLIEATVSHFGKINILINNAGISMRAAFIETDMSVLHRLMETNFWGAVYCTKFALPYLLQTKGSLVGVSSIAGYKGLPGRSGYTASKAALQGFLDVIRIENLYKGLHVMTACPGFTASNIRVAALTSDGSEQGESPREEEKMMTAEEVAYRIANGVLRRKREIVLTFDGKATVFLNKFFPSLLDRLVFRRISKEPGSPIK